MWLDQFGQHIQFPQYPGLTFSSMEAAFDYIEAYAKSQKQRAIQPNAQLVDYAPQHARRPRVLDPCERMWQFDASLEPVNSKSVVRILTPYLKREGHCFELAAEPISQEPLKAPYLVYPSSQSWQPETPPETLFAESTPHAQIIQGQPRVELPAEELQSPPFHVPVMNGFSVQQPLPSPPSPPSPPANEASTLVEDHDALRTCHDSFSPPPYSNDDILAQPQSSYGSYPLPSLYSATVLPQTLINKDKRVLGVPLTANTDEYVTIPLRCGPFSSSLI